MSLWASGWGEARDCRDGRNSQLGPQHSGGQEKGKVTRLSLEVSTWEGYDP